MKRLELINYQIKYSHSTSNTFTPSFNSQNITSQIGSKKYQPHFQFTTQNGCLTLSQRKFYQQNGYIVVKGLLKQKDIQKWTKRFRQYCNKDIPPLPGMQIVRDISLAKSKSNLTGQASITKIQDFQYDEELHSFCSNPDIIPYLKSFCGNNIKSIHTMFINKPPNMGSSSRHPFHQDLAYFPFGPANRIVAGWASLQDSTKQNGSLNIFPGSHKGQFYDHGYPQWNGMVNKAYLGIKNYKQIGQPVDLQLKKGDIVFFHPLLIHGSGQNKTQGYRKSMCCHFADASCTYLSIKGSKYEYAASQVMSYIKYKYPVTDYLDYWRLKSRLVVGNFQQNGL